MGRGCGKAVTGGERNLLTTATPAPPPSRPARAVFMGTPDFAAVILRRLLQRPDLVTVAAAVTQPDRPAGRGRRLEQPPVKVEAARAGVEVAQPVSVRRPRFAEWLQRLAPDLLLVAAYGKILPPAVLSIPPRGALNVHASLLPRHRGASPVSAALLAGDTVTGVSLMLMNEAMDAGPVLATAAEPIAPDDTTETLTARLSSLGATLLLDTLPPWLAGAVTAQPQDSGQATYCRPLRRDDGRLLWDEPAEHLARQVRAMIPWPGAYTYWTGQQLKVWAATALAADAGSATPPVPGTVVEQGRRPAVVCGEGLLALDQVQLAGRRRMAAADFLRGQRAFVGARLSASDPSSLQR